MLKVLGLDPGEKNFGWSMCKARTVGMFYEVKPMDSGLLQKTITNLKMSSVYQAQYTAFHQEFQKLLTAYNPDVVVMERFMGRGVKIGTTSETTNLMMGIITQLREGNIELVNPANWKAAYKKQVKVDLKDHYKLCRVIEHQFDAALIGVYGVAHKLGRRPLECFKCEEDVFKFMQGVEGGSCHTLINRRKRRGRFA